MLDAWLDTWGAEAMKTWSLAAELRQVHCPLLAIRGADDEFSTDEPSHFIAAHAGGPVTRCLLPECGHVPHREKTAEVLAACSDWLYGQEIA